MKKSSYILLMLATLVGAVSCKEYLDINEDPRNPQLAEGHVLLPPIFAQMALSEQFDTRYIGKYVQNFHQATANDTWDRHGYIPGSDASGEKWRAHYWSIGRNIDLIIEDGRETGKWDYVGAAKAIRAWSWLTTTDYHGDIILRQAWEPNRYVFQFDPQEAVYAEAERLANEAITDLSRTDGRVSQASLGRGDLVYKGDREKWIKFTYGTLARLENHKSNKADYNPDRVIEYVNKSMTGSADNFAVPFAGTSTADGNFFGPRRDNLTLFRQSAFAVSLLDGSVFGGVEDPRLPIMLTASPDGVYRGVVAAQGDPNNTTGNVRLIPTPYGTLPGVPLSTATGKYIFRNDAPMPLMTYFELQFVKAEAAFRKGDRAMALTAYQEGIRAHMEFAGVAAAARSTFLNSAAVAQNAAQLTLSDIMLQKYIAMYGHGALETWVDMRRYQYSPEVYTGFTLPTNLFPDNNGKPAYRVRPRFNSEYVWNRQSLETVGGNNPDYHTYEVWFSLPSRLFVRNSI